jgi:ABC-type amino acid transport system permease subunit
MDNVDTNILFWDGTNIICNRQKNIDSNSSLKLPSSKCSFLIANFFKCFVEVFSNLPLLLFDMFLYWYELDFMQGLLDIKEYPFMPGSAI